MYQTTLVQAQMTELHKQLNKLQRHIVNQLPQVPIARSGFDSRRYQIF
jgi:hypothetical protein